ncbi:hypothetical protein MSAN_00473200 [Mycena sanguinolenta]|uniref:Uncharacterized protein n=1 Tax=Mycena sanguinolenta TaxID=230812 RepID=A0A8H6ZBE1_9AGAR|nr:hypothetical protein MSAN_00473200 [Mycena sanguinolenta]
MVIGFARDGIAKQKKLRLLVTQNTPISGFYGPGSWWAWLITLGMTHAHMGVNFLVSGELPEELDYDLIGASGYIVAAAIDLTLKGRAIGHLGDGACGSPLLPALLCAERAVSVGTASSLFTIATASYVGGFSARRRVGIAIVPLVFVIVALGYSFRAHQAIYRENSRTPCRLPDGSRLVPGVSFMLVDIPPVLFQMVTAIVGGAFMSRLFWLVTGVIAAIPPVLAILLDRKLSWSTLNLSASIIAIAVLYTLMLGLFLTMGILAPLGLWVLLWGLQYIIAFFPEMGSFPVTGMSVMDMDQLAALLGVGFIAAFRTGLRILRIVRSRAHPAASTHEEHELTRLDP